MSKLRRAFIGGYESCSRLCVFLLMPIAGCMTPVPRVPPVDGFVRTKQAAGCWEHTEPREYHVAMGRGLEQQLRAQLTGRVLDFPQCWYEGGAGEILFIAGEECSAHDEFTFRKVEGTWNLVTAERQELVMCHERKR